ncbi:hypothetical protein [Roseomonas haemaphysalidis]|uniref:Uncharacterized protein n=1 Tax=Roseomonas haemaphysalidis TaxID=2768162 RepID=A0ABS3KTC0_9PROT|nr:hypothetical protein [Roseomonas haemaphysalidis]MBO1079863.1 hypothetical protein [Roseomonas haemaphysalidis]
MLRKVILSALLVTGLSGAAMAQEPLRVLGTGENFAVDYSNDGGNILGGGPVTVIGSGESARYLHAQGAPAQRGWLPTAVGTGESGKIAYQPTQNAYPEPNG